MGVTVFAPALRLDRPDGYGARAPKGLVSPLTLPYWDRYSAHPGEGLTPRTVVTIFHQAEYGFPQEQCDLFEDIIQSDGHLRSQLDTRRDSVAGKEWIIQAGGDAPEDHRAAVLLEEAIQQVENFGEMMEHQLSCPAYGYAATEILWAPGANGAIAPIWFANVPHRRFIFDSNDQPLLISPDNYAGIPLEPGRFLFSKRYGRVTVAAGLLRTAVWWALWKRMSIRDWVAFAERFGIPLAIGKYRDDMPEIEKKAVRDAVAMIGKDGYAAFSESGQIEFAKADGGSSSDVHPALASFCNAEMSKLITGATLTSGEGTSAGSYALGRVHENVSFNLIMSDAKRLGDWFAQQIGRPFCRWNKIDGRPPRLRIHVVREVDPQVRMDIISRAANEIGLKLDEDQIRQEFQLKIPVGGTLTGSKTAAAGLEKPKTGSEIG
jgi:phage gp29-like protein